LGVFTAILPALSGFSIQIARTSTQRRRARNKNTNGPSILSVIIFITLTIYETVVVTLSGTHIGPESDLTCGLNEQWASLFRAKESKSVRRIQDAFNCCGLHSVKDKAWPFPDKNHGVDACVKAFGRTKSCFESWRGEEQRMAVLLLLVPIAVFVWQVGGLHRQFRCLIFLFVCASTLPADVGKTLDSHCDSTRNAAVVVATDYTASSDYR
jgi:hypothetical protein